MAVKQYKIDKVTEIESHIEANAGVFVVNYNGLTVKQAQDLRHQLREVGAEMKVYKNNLARIALKNQGQPEIDELLVGPVAYVFYETEPVEAAKVLKDFSAAAKDVLKVKGGISEGKAVTADEVKAIAELPTKDQLLGQIAGLISGFSRDIAVCVNGVSGGLARSIQQVSEQKAA
ncbi:50S ribosomal protein L10 [Collinsella vaginalis]|uniref:50S ribosomal protein L10 n=1 Tax=Collinsella vaginalis TaxID=1870987 RepID=UPI000A2698A0|nr:50S ribosomal protein L10 [Collinsella vaginalis]